MNDGLRLLRSALGQLPLEAPAQRTLVAGSVVTDELAMDVDGALAVLRGHPEALAALDEGCRADLARLDRLLDAPPGAAQWDDDALDHDPVWSEARVLARRLLDALPAGTGGSAFVPGRD